MDRTTAHPAGFRFLTVTVIAVALGSGCLVDFAGPGTDVECGNGEREGGEVCDGTDFEGQTCASALGSEFGELRCTVACQLDVSDCHSCGNGVQEPEESCDDGDSLDGDGCSGRCQVELGWVCDGAPSLCDTICGDGRVRGLEACDDGNTDDGDGCTDLCEPEAGWVCVGEPSECELTCGDATLDAGETCDDGNLQPGDGCSPNCAEESGWSCSGEPSVCNGVCGDGVLVGAEACDDGNTQPGDGCAPNCGIESGWECQGEPSVCAAVCGDGLLLGGEICDDGNAQDGDGCDSTCQVEPFNACWGEPSACYCVVYVDRDPVANPRTGADWSSAAATMQTGLSAAQGRGTCELWVAEGTYHVYESAPGNRLQLWSNLALYGGFSGTETRRGDRDWIANVTVLSGAQETNPGNTVRNIMRFSGATGVVVDGFTLQAADSGGGDRGGGMRVDNSEVTVRSCIFQNNFCGEGGAIYAGSSDLAVFGSTFQDNSSSNVGGAIYLDQGTLTLERSVIYGNTAGDDGGGVCIAGGVGTVLSCHFEANSTATARGGGLRFMSGATGTVTNTTFIDNYAGQGGGAVALYQTPQPAQITNCTFDGNAALGGMGATVRVVTADVAVANSIVWGTSVDQIVTMLGGSAQVRYSDVYGDYAGSGNIDADPLFSNPGIGIFTLSAGSPCVDAADGDIAPAADLNGSPRVDDPNTAPNTGVGTPDFVDMGAFEYQP
ncbi:MAG: DUF4215 domain-containing protein [bacterium]